MSSASPTISISPTSPTGHQAGSDTASAHARVAAPGRPPGGSRSVPSACRTFGHPSKECPRGILRAHERVGCRIRPLRRRAGDSQRPARVRERGNRAVRREHDPAVIGVERVLLDQPREQRVVRKPRKKPVAQTTCGSPLSSGQTRNRPVCAARSSGSSQARPLGYDGASRSCNHSDRCGASVSWKWTSPRREKSGRGTFSGRRRGSRLRMEATRAPAASALRHSVAAAIPAPTTATSSAYSCGWYACTARLSPGELCREGEACVTRCQQDMAEASLAVEREALVDPPDPRDAAEPDTLVPGRPFALLGDVVEKLLDRRVEAVAHALHQRRN